MLRTLFVLLFFTFLSITSYCAVTIPDSIINKCNTAKDAQILTQQEKGVILYMNIARCYPKYFYDIILVPYMDSAKTKTKTKYYKTLKPDMYKVMSLKPLTFNEKLYPISKAHAKDMGKHGMEGHASSKGISFEERTSEFQGCGENCDYGNSKALDIVFSLILDDNVPSFGHRKNILNQNYKTVSVSIQKHKTYQWNCVIDFTN